MSKISVMRGVMIALVGLVCSACVETGPYGASAPGYRYGTYVDHDRDFRRYPRYSRWDRYEPRDRYHRFDPRPRFENRRQSYLGPFPRRQPGLATRYDRNRFARIRRPDVYRADRERNIRGGFRRPSDIRGGRRLIIPRQ